MYIQLHVTMYACTHVHSVLYVVNTVVTNLCFGRVTKKKKAICTYMVHCHDDLGYALENTLAGIQSGVQQAEVTVAGIGARKGNCNLVNLVHREEKLSHYATERLNEAEELLLAAITNR